jgi:hypothetical protein
MPSGGSNLTLDVDAPAMPPGAHRVGVDVEDGRRLVAKLLSDLGDGQPLLGDQQRRPGVPEVIRPGCGKPDVLGGGDVDPPTPSPIVLTEPQAARARSTAQ